MKILIAILLILSSYSSYSKTRDLNIYGTLLASTGIGEFDLEYSVLNFDVLGTESTTYLKYGASVFGAYDFALFSCQPIIGFVQYFGTDYGLDIGVNYFNVRKLGYWNKAIPREQRIAEKENYEAIGFEIGAREYYGNNVLRATFTPFYKLNDDNNANKTFFQSLIFSVGISWGYSF